MGKSMPDLLLGRDDLTEYEFYSRYYDGQGIEKVVVAEILNHIACELSLPASKLRPSDRFSIELAPQKGSAWDSGYGILIYEIKRLATKKNVRIDNKVETIDDCIRLLSMLY